MQHTLNIGLGSIRATEALHALHAHGITPNGWRFEDSDSETTLVVRAPAVRMADLYKVAEELGEDAIAVQPTGGGRGALIGPEAEKWGEFNSRFFIRF